MLVQIITPSSVVFDHAADIAIIPGEEGEFGVLPNHAPVIANLQPGIVQVNHESSSFRYFIYGGISGVGGENVNILTEFAVNMQETDKADILGKLQKLVDHLAAEEDENIKRSLQRDIDTYRTLIKFCQ